MASSAKTTGESERRRDSNRYFSGCRKESNCVCEICLDSINATLDLMPLTVRKSYLSRISYASQSKSVSLPISRMITLPPTKKERRFGICVVLKSVLILGLALSLGLGFFWVLKGVLKPQFTKEIVSCVGERSQAVLDLGAKMRLFKDGPMLNSKCVLNKSGIEEVVKLKWRERNFGCSRLEAKTNGTHPFCS